MLCLYVFFAVFVKPVSKISSDPGSGLIHAEITLWYHSGVLFLFVLGVGQTLPSCFWLFQMLQDQKQLVITIQLYVPAFCLLWCRAGWCLSDPTYWSHGGFLVAVSKYSKGAGEAPAKFATHCQYAALQTASTAHESIQTILVWS